MSAAPNTQMVRRVAAPGGAPRPAARRGSWPGLSDLMQDAASAIMNGRTPDPNRFNTRKHIFYHRQNYATAGTSSIKFFSNVAPEDHICNLPTQGMLGAETFFRLEAVRFKVETGVTSAANPARVAAGAQATSGATTNTVLPMIEELRTILQQGLVFLRVGDRKVVDGVHGMDRFPQGTGVDAVAAIATNSATTLATHMALLANGQPHVGNAFILNPKFALLPQKPIDLELRFQALMTVTTQFVLKAELEGTLVTPGNL